MTLDDLKEAMPDIATKLGAMMVQEGIGTFQAMGLTLDDAEPSVSMTIQPKDGSAAVKITLTIEAPLGA